MMSEITMPIDLASAVSLLSGGNVAEAAVSDGAGFGDILGQLMGGADSAAVILTAPEAVQAAEILPEETADPVKALMALLAGDDEAQLPEVFDAKGAQAFTETVDKFLDGKFSAADVKKLWEEVPDEEKAAYVQLLRTVFTGGEFRVSDADGEKEDISADMSLKAVLAMVLKSAARKNDRKDSGKEETPVDPWFMQGVSLLNFSSVPEVISEAAEKAGEAEIDVISESASAAVYAETDMAAVSEMVIEKDVPERKEMPSEEKVDGIAVDKKDNFAENIQKVYDKISDTDPEDIKAFCKELADQLETQIEANSRPAAEIRDNFRFEDGRQAVMSRVNRPLEEIPAQVAVKDTAMEIPAVTEEAAPVEEAAVTERTSETEEEDAPVIKAESETKAAPGAAPVQTVTRTVSVQAAIPAAEITHSEHILPRSEDITSQIMDRIELYKDVFSENFTERELTMKLHPEELGELEIKIRRTGGGLEIRFTAQKAEAAELIGDRAAQLAEAVASRGVKLKEVYISERIVTAESSEQFAQGDFQRQGFYQGADGGNSSGRRFTFSGDNAVEEISSVTETETEGQVYNREAKLWVSA